MRIIHYLLGRQLATSEESEQRVGPLAGIPMLGLDALSSSAYGPEAALTILLPLGAAGLHLLMPLMGAVLGLLFIVFLSYRQTIEAYPNGGGSYTVASQNLGMFSGILAAAALLLDYILTVAVGIAAGVGALISAIPAAQPHTLALCLVILIVLTLINLRGVKEAGAAFLLPTYAFLACMGVVLIIGLIQAAIHHGAPVPIEPLHALPQKGLEAASLWLVLRAFASGCTAMTGVEAVSNGVKVFREPVVGNARRTLTAIVVILMAMLAAIAYLAVAYGIGATLPGEAGYESVISQLVRGIVGQGIFYYITIGTVTVMLCLSANTAFADFPRLFQIIAKDGFLPEAFSERGRRLVFSNGIIALAVFAGVLLIVFNGVTDNLIPLYAIGAFLAFTISQLGMVFHWLKKRRLDPALRIWPMLLVNGAGAIATGITLVIVLLSKFSEGGWISAIAIPIFVSIFYGIHHHYDRVRVEIASLEPLAFEHTLPPIVVVPMRRWNKSTRKALTVAVEMSPTVYAVHVELDDNECEIDEALWEKLVVQPAHKAGGKGPILRRLDSPYRMLFSSFFEFINELEATYPDQRVAVVIPSVEVMHWYENFLHNHRSLLLIAALYLRRDNRLVWSTVPWFLEK